MLKRNFIVSLTGGLGNQLFQLAAGLKISEGEVVRLTAAYGNPRPFDKTTAELYSFNLPANVNIIEKKPASLFVKKCVGYNLRMGTDPRKYENLKIVRWLIKCATSSLLFFDLHQFFKLVAGKGVGFNQISISKKNSLLVGYFQSYRWASDSNVLKVLKNIKPIERNTLLENLIIKAKAEKPLFVHVRLADYKNEEKIGIPSRDYYSNSVKKLMKSGRFSNIWLFSDEVETAKNYIPEEYKEILTIIPEIDNSPALTLELLRHGSGYVIANSSFSWWGAFLSYEENVKVIAPYPWFKNLDSPLDLIPPSWETSNPW